MCSGVQPSAVFTVYDFLSCFYLSWLKSGRVQPMFDNLSEIIMFPDKEFFTLYLTDKAMFHLIQYVNTRVTFLYVPVQYWVWTLLWLNIRPVSFSSKLYATMLICWSLTLSAVWYWAGNLQRGFTVFALKGLPKTMLMRLRRVKQKG